MAKRYFPFDDADVVEYQWGKMAKLWRGTGVVNEELNQFEPFADSSGMVVKVKSGIAWIEGFFFESDAEESVTIEAADSTNDRIDLIVVQLDRANNKIDIVVKKGTDVVPPIVPTTPSLTQTSSKWEIPIAEVVVDHGAVSISPGDVMDRREMSLDIDSLIGLIIVFS